MKLVLISLTPSCLTLGITISVVKQIEEIEIQLLRYIRQEKCNQWRKATEGKEKIKLLFLQSVIIWIFLTLRVTIEQHSSWQLVYVSYRELIRFKLDLIKKYKLFKFIHFLYSIHGEEVLLDLSFFPRLKKWMFTYSPWWALL